MRGASGSFRGLLKAVGKETGTAVGGLLIGKRRRLRLEMTNLKLQWLELLLLIPS